MSVVKIRETEVDEGFKELEEFKDKIVSMGVVALLDDGRMFTMRSYNKGQRNPYAIVGALEEIKTRVVMTEIIG